MSDAEFYAHYPNQPTGIQVRHENGTTTNVPVYYREDGFISATRALSPVEVQAVCFRIGREYGPAALFDLYGQSLITDETLGAVIGGVWAAAEHPADSIAPEDWAEWFRTVGVRNSAGQRVNAPAGLQVFRGADAAEKETGDFGMSWTTDRNLAIWFATEYAHRSIAQPVVYSTIAPESAVLADLRDDEREENEIVLDRWALDPEHITATAADIDKEAEG